MDDNILESVEEERNVGVNIETRRKRGDLIEAFKIIKG